MSARVSTDDATSPQPARIAVIGGGISGLAAAYRLTELSSPARPLQVALLECSGRLGGTIATEAVDGYLIEHGPDSFITDKPWALDLCRRLGLSSRLIDTDERYRRSLILHRGRPVPTPVGLQLMAATRIWPFLTTPLLTPLGKLRLAAEPLVPRRREGDDESVASFVRRRMGREMLERIVQPMVGGIYTSDPERLSLAATLPRFIEMEREHGSLWKATRRNRASRVNSRDRGSNSGAEACASGARYGLFAGLAGGMQELVDTLANRVRASGEIDLGQRAESVMPLDGRRWRVMFAGTPAREFDALVLAVPAWCAADLLATSAPDLAARLREIDYASSAVVVTGHQLADVAHPLDAFGMVIPHREGRRILAVSFLSRKFAGRAPEGRVLLRTFVGGALQPELLDRSDGELASLVLEELQSTLGVAGRPEFTRVTRYNRAMPQYHVGHVERVQGIESAAGAIPGLALAGNGYRGAGIPDCVQSGELAAERVTTGLQNSPGGG